MENSNYIMRVLVVDDVVNNYTYIMNVLKKQDCEVLYAGNGRDAVDICKITKDIDLVFMDLNLPIINGFEATKQIKEFRKHLPIIAITAYSSGENRRKAKDSGCNDYLVKPVFMIQIENIIQKYKNYSLSVQSKHINKSMGAIKYL